MYAEFTKSLCQHLIANDYGIVLPLNNVALTQKTPIVVLARSISPVLYIVNIINGDAMPVTESTAIVELQNLQMEKAIQNMHCSYAVCINLIVTNISNAAVQAFIDEKQFVNGEKINQVWWQVDISQKQLIFGKNQPTKILNIAKIIQQSFLISEDADIFSDGDSLKAIEQSQRVKTAVPVLSQNYQVTLSLIFINIIVWAYLNLTGSEALFFQRFANDSQRVIYNHQYYRLVTSAFLHSGVTHLGYNCISLYIFGSRVEKYLGKKTFIWLYFLSALGGNIASVCFTGGISVGASGAIFGIIGAFIAFSGSNRREIEGFNFITILLWAVVGIAIGFMGIGVDNFAHLGGIATGLVIEWINIKFINTKD
jgi:Uncharacterized membrane protein (homolog of Drosophila rhomboid)